MNKGWALIDAEAMHRAAPETFHIASRSNRERLGVGRMVKIGVEQPNSGSRHNGERFWVKILGAGRTLRYAAMICNDLVFTERHGLAHGERIEFDARHVLLTEEPKPEDAPKNLMTRKEMLDSLAPPNN